MKTMTIRIKTKIARNMELIKELLMSKVDDEGQLSDWAKTELTGARNTLNPSIFLLMKSKRE